MNFSWQRFCDDRGIRYLTSGAHTSKGNIEIACPLCNDGAERMGLKLDPRKPYYSCWRNPEHSGRNPVRLIALLLHCSYAEAENIVAAADASSKIDDYEAVAAGIYSEKAPPAETQEPEVLKMPSEFHHFSDRGGDAYFEYLRSRGFNYPDEFADRYDLRFCRIGYFSLRIVLPVYWRQQLVSWTARDITGKTELRYRTLSSDAKTAKHQGATGPALLPLKSVVYNGDKARAGGRTLFVCEGPFDALKIDWYAKEDHAVAVFGMPERKQLVALFELALGFDRVAVVLDLGAQGSALTLAADLDGCGRPVKTLQLLGGVKDPGVLGPIGVSRLCRRAAA